MSDLPAGRELDALVAEKVMGWHRSERDYAALAWNTPDGFREWTAPWRPFRPSTDIAAAWEVVEKLQPDLYLTLVVERHKGKQYVDATFTGVRWKTPGAVFNVCECEPVPLAICRAALKAVGA